MRYRRKGKGAFCASAAERLSNGPLASRYPTRSKSSPVGLQWAWSVIRSRVDMPEALNHSGLGQKETFRRGPKLPLRRSLSGLEKDQSYDTQEHHYRSKSHWRCG